MSALETKAKPVLVPLIRGRTPKLDKPDQRLLATWAFKTAVMLGQMNPATRRVIPREHLSHLYEHGEPDMNVHVFAAAHDAKSPEDTFYRDTTLDLHLPPESGHPRDAYVATLAVRHLAFQVIGSRVPDSGWNHSAPLDAYVRRLWPFVGSFKWPPGKVLNRDALYALADHWKGV